ncbi:MAG TPA: hypothetical protein VF411_15990 [Bacteroidia bacterium]
MISTNVAIKINAESAWEVKLFNILILIVAKGEKIFRRHMTAGTSSTDKTTCSVKPAAGNAKHSAKPKRNNNDELNQRNAHTSTSSV